jgi:hypothetical protein
MFTIEDDLGQVLARLATQSEYLLPNGSRMSVSTTPAWCRGCKKFVLAEKLQKPEEMEAGARQFFHDKPTGRLPYDVVPKAIQDADDEKLLKKFLREAEQWRLALKRRTSPPRCLNCGGCNFDRLPENDDWMPHPLEPGRRVRIGPDGSLVTLSGRGDLYDTEGKRISGHVSK